MGGSRLEIVSQGPTADGCRIRLDGVEIQSTLRGLTLSMATGEVVRAELDVLIFSLSELSDEVRVDVPDETRELLVKLGWTPPEDAQPHDVSPGHP